MKRIFRLELLLSCAIGFFAVQSLRAEPSREERLKAAIQLSNQGKRDEAVEILKNLSAEQPSDDRVLLSLGLVYRSMNQFQNAIEAFERAVRIRYSEEGWYSLGLLYEGMIVKDGGSASLWTSKAKSAWRQFLQLKPQDTRKAEVASRHLKNLEEAADVPLK